MHLDFSDIIAAISLAWTAITFGRTVRHRPEASWMNSYIVTRLPNATPSLTDEHGRLPVRKAMIANDGDGDAFDVRVFGHNCIIRAYAWEKLSNGNWKIGERTMVPRISNEDGDDVKIAIWPPEGCQNLHPLDQITHKTAALRIRRNTLHFGTRRQMVGGKGLEGIAQTGRTIPRMERTPKVPPQSRRRQKITATNHLNHRDA